jgi:hypothetical protein
MKCQENQMKYDFLNCYVMKTSFISHWAITKKGWQWDGKDELVAFNTGIF